MKRFTHALISAVASATLLLPLAPAATAATAATAASGTTHAAPAKISPATVIARAKSWLTANGGHQVPYSTKKTRGGYRTDCSGYVSMALMLSKPGPNTVTLATKTYTTQIAIRRLRMGDLVIDPKGSLSGRHVVIFYKWNNSAHTSYWAYEQRGGHGTDFRPVSYGLKSDQYDAYRPNKY